MPNRILREGLRTSETINSVSFGAECLYVHLLTCVDDFGRMEYIAKAFKAEVFPARDVRDADVTRLLSELEEAGAVRRYDCNSKRYIVLSKVDAPRAKTSRCPQPPSGYACWRETNNGVVYGTEHTGVHNCKRLLADASICEQTQADARTCEQTQARANICTVSECVSVIGSECEQKPPASAVPLKGERKRREPFVPPPIEDVAAYMRERGWRDWERMAPIWVAHYAKQGWVCGKGRVPMKDWKAAVITWEKGDDIVIERREGAERYYEGACGVCGAPGRGRIMPDGTKLGPLCDACRMEMQKELAI